MSFRARTFRILIASPSDLSEEREVATSAINEWNDQHATRERIVLLPVKWETHARPQSIRPQQAINDQLVSDCDMLIGLFWTRIGTSTGIAESGTIEEIDQFVKASKPAQLYFSRRPIDPQRIDIKQHKKLSAFRTKTLRGALTGEFNNLTTLRSLLIRNLTSEVNALAANAPKQDKIDQAKRITDLYRVHREEKISPEDFAKFSEQIVGVKRTKSQTSDPVRPGEVGPNGHPIGYLKNGDKVEWLPDEETPDGPPIPMVLRRNDNDILKARSEFWDKVWWNRHQNWLYRLSTGEEKISSLEEKKIFMTARKAAQRIEKKYGKKNLGWDDFEWGMVNGKLSALNWVMGDEWDFLDT